MKATDREAPEGPPLGEVLGDRAIGRAAAVQTSLVLLAKHTDGETDVFDVLRIAQFIDQAKGVDD